MLQFYGRCSFGRFTMRKKKRFNYDFHELVRDFLLIDEVCCRSLRHGQWLNFGYKSQVYKSDPSRHEQQ